MILVAIEGIDGSGKTLQFELLRRRLSALGKTSQSLSFPRYEAFIGKEIGSMLSGRLEDARADKIDAKSMALWYAADRRQAFDEIKADTDYLLLNRYVLANVVYQGLRVDNTQRENFIRWVYELEHEHFKLPPPDFYIILDVDTKTSAENVGKKGYRDYVGDKADVYEGKTDFLEGVRQAYLELGGGLPGATVISCTPHGGLLPPEEIHRQILLTLGLMF